jgi:hypothetical protein
MNLNNLAREVEGCKVKGVKPRVHPNGFIQLDRDERTRFHFWAHPDIPRQARPTPIHDHSFGFESLVLIGALVNIRYRARPSHRFDSTHSVYQAYCPGGEETRLEPTGDAVRLIPEIMGATVLREGASYRENPWEIHQTIVDVPTVTVIFKDGPTLAQRGPAPHVYVPVGVEPDNSFRRDVLSPEFLWAIIDDIMGAQSHAA